MPTSKTLTKKLAGKKVKTALVTINYTRSNKKINFIPIHMLFEMCSKKKPHDIAVKYGSCSITYENLNAKANQLAHLLISFDIQPGKPVAVCMDKCIETIISVLGILKAGGIYVPINSKLPHKSIHHILQETCSSILITDGLQKNLPPSIKNLIELNSASQALLKLPTSSPEHLTNPKQLAYIFYTSGTTGHPKGVMVNHFNLFNAYEGWRKAYQLKKITACHLQMANYFFDVFMGDLVRSLCMGSTLILCPSNILLKPRYLYELMRQEKVNCAEFVPAILRKLVDYLIKNDLNLEFMKILICGSDTWTMREYFKFQALCGEKTRLINSYGITEATIDSTYFESSIKNKKKFLPDSLVPIGKPFPKTVIYLLDENLHPVSKGNIGEIYIGGAGVATGYLNRPDLTNEKFVVSPFSKSLHNRLYKTGDLGRYLPDSNIEFLGRLDTQIKINGHRIELSAIENTLNTHPIIQESLVRAEQNEKAKKQHLVAYIVPKNDDSINTLEIRTFLKDHLPNHMIPVRYHVIKGIPLTQNGKVNRLSQIKAKNN